MDTLAVAVAQRVVSADVKVTESVCWPAVRIVPPGGAYSSVPAAAGRFVVAFSCAAPAACRR
jgi:hypothetical protein